MENKDFIETLEQKGWNIQSAEVDTSLNIDRLANGRMAQAPKEIKDFISCFKLCVNQSDTTWFLSYKDYQEDTDAEFSWNEFEIQSLEDMDEDDIETVSAFWEKYLPIWMSVENSYQFIAIGIDESNYGQIFHGIEPEYESVACIASSFSEFKKLYLEALDGTFYNECYKLVN